MAAVMLVGAGLWAGVVIVGSVCPRLERDLLWIAATAIGLVFASWTAFGVAWVSSGLGMGEVAVAALILGAGAIALGRVTRPKVDRPPRWFLTAAILAAVGFGSFSAYGVLSTDRSGVVYAVGNAWADIPFHTSIATSFTYGDNFPPTYVIAAGEPLGYPFLVDLLTGVLDAGGLSLWLSVAVVNGAVAAMFVVGLLTLVRVLTGSLRVAGMAMFIVLLLGNLGVLAVPGDVAEAGGWGAWLADLPWDYTGESLGTQGRARLGTGLYLGNPMMLFFVPRRAGALGLAVGVVVFALVAHVLTTSGPARIRTAAIAGLIAGLLPRIHAHTAITVLIVCAVWVGLHVVSDRRRRETIRAVGLAAVVGLLVASPQIASMAAQAGGFFTWGWLGWTGEARDAVQGFILGDRSLFSAAWSFVWFWFLNTGFLLLLLPAAAVVAPRTLRTWWAGFGALWVFANSVKTQPWEWDNSSYFVWWQVATAVLVAHLLVDVWSRRGTHWTERAARAAVPVLVVGLVAGGPLSVLRTAQDRVGLWHTEEASFAVAVRERVPLGDLVLTAPAHAHPVPALSGRHVVMGFGGWLFSHGLDFRAYATEVDRMLAGDLDLVRDRGVDFVVDGPLERAHIATRDLGPGIFASDALTLVYEVEADGERWRLFAVDG